MLRVIEYFDVTQRHPRSLEMAAVGRPHTTSYWRSIVTMAISCIISVIKRGIGRKSRFFPSPAFDAPLREGSRRDIAKRSGTEKLKRCGYHAVVKKFEKMITRFDAMHERDGQLQTDRQERETDRRQIERQERKTELFIYVAVSSN